MALACEALGVPIVSGNVSLYNDTGGRSIPPTPVVAASASSRTCGACRAAGARAMSSCSPARARRSRSPARRRRPAGGRSAGRRRSTSRSETRSSATRASRRGSLARPDAAEGGLAVALARRRSGAGSGPSSTSRTSAHAVRRVGGQVIVAVSPDRSSPTRPAKTRREGIGHGRRRRLFGIALGNSRRRPRGRLMCGVFGVRSRKRDITRSRTSVCHAAASRQESAGIAVSEGGRVTAVREMGLVPQVFDEEKLARCQARWRSATRGTRPRAARWWNAQPLVHHGAARTVALAHNGNLVDPEPRRDELVASGVRLDSTSDTEVIAGRSAATCTAPRGHRRRHAAVRGRYSIRRDRRRNARGVP